MNQELTMPLKHTKVALASACVLTGCGVPAAWKDIILISKHGPYQIESCQKSDASSSPACKTEAAAKCSELGLQHQGDVEVKKNADGQAETYVTCFEATY